jgi:hypothetical protein
MGRRSAKLQGKEELVKNLIQYVQTQTGMAQAELEKLFKPQSMHSRSAGKQWSRWATGYVQPGISVVAEIFDFCVNKLISGEWKSNGQEGEWSHLLDAVGDPKILLLAKHRYALLIAYNCLQAPGLITQEKIRGIEAGYYLPTIDEIDTLFFYSTKHHRDAPNVSLRAITVRNEHERDAVRSMLKEVEIYFGENQKDQSKLASFNRKWGIIGGDKSWSSQLLARMHNDASALREIAERYKFLGGSITENFDEAKIGNQIDVLSSTLESRIEKIYTMNMHDRIEWENEFYNFIVKFQGLDESIESKYLSVVELDEFDFAGRNNRGLSPHFFAPIAGKLST